MISPEEFGALLTPTTLETPDGPVWRSPDGRTWLLSPEVDDRARQIAATRNLAALVGLPAPASRLALVGGRYVAAGRLWVAWTPWAARPWAVAGVAAGRPADDWLSATWPDEGLRARPDAPALGLGALRLAPGSALGRSPVGPEDWRTITRPRAVGEAVTAARLDVAARVAAVSRSAVLEALDAAGYAPPAASDLADLLMVRAAEIGRLYAPDAT